MPPLAPGHRAIASHASCFTGLSPTGGVGVSSGAVRAWRALNPAISRPPTRCRLAENSTRANFRACVGFGAAEDFDTAARRCALCRAASAPAGFCSNCFLAGAAPSVSNSVEIAMNVIRIAEERAELFCRFFRLLLGF